MFVPRARRNSQKRPESLSAHDRAGRAAVLISAQNIKVLRASWRIVRRAVARSKSALGRRYARLC
jgi:hypothetical protein